MNEPKKAAPQNHFTSVAERAEAAKQLLNNVVSNVASVLQPERYLNFLNIIERFHWYSYVNGLLILSQYPQAQYLAGIEVWKRTSLSTYNDPNRRFLKYSETGKGIKLIAPFTLVDGASRSLISMVVPVYDVNQMNDIPAPETDFLDVKKCTYVDIINAINFVAPYRTVFASNEDENLTHNVKGYCNHSFKQVVVDSRLPARGLLSTLLHEYIVAELFLRGYTDVNLQGLIVESVFYVLVKHFNLPTDDITFSYISRFKNAENQALAEAFSLIQILSHLIIESIEEHLEFIVELNPVDDEFACQVDLFDEIGIGTGGGGLFE